MKLRTLTIQGFLSFGETASVLDLADRGIVMVEGVNTDEDHAKSNGAGKSTLVDALVWCLYGVTLRGYEGDDVINRHLGGECMVRLTLETEGSVYRIVRSRKHTEWKTGLRLFKDADDVTGFSIKDTERKVQRLIGMTLPTFTNAAVFGQSALYRFSTLTDGEQKAVLDDALGTADYVAAREVATDEARTLDVNLATAAAEATTMTTHHAKLTEARRVLAHERDQWEAERRLAVRRLNARLAAVKAEIHTVKARAGTPVDVAALTADVATARAADERAADAAVAARGAAAVAEGALTEAQEHCNAAIRGGVGTCGSCGQEVSAKYLKGHIATLEARARKRGDARVASKQALERARNARTLTRGAVDAAEQTLAEARTALSSEERDRRALETLRTERERLKTEIDALTTGTGGAAGGVAALDAQIAKADTDLATLTRDIKRADRAHEELEAQRARYTFWVEAFGPKGIRSLLIDTVLPFLNEQVARFARALTGGTMAIEFTTQATLKSGKTAERFDVMVTSDHGAGTYKGHSAGERAKIDLCVGLALQALVMQRARTRLNVVFMDEPFEHLDETAIERVTDLLATLPYESLFVITHNDALRGYFPGTVTVRKHAGQSTLD